MQWVARRDTLRSVIDWRSERRAAEQDTSQTLTNEADKTHECEQNLVAPFQSPFSIIDVS
jgi:hypothetical protein